MRHGRQLMRWVQGLLMAMALLVALAPTASFAADTRQGDVITVSAGQTVDDDLYAFGRAVDIQGRVNGDVVASGATVTVHGIVTGDLLAAGGTTTVTGQVDGTVRAAGGTVAVDGSVGKDMIVSGGTVRLGPSAHVGRDLLAGAGSVILDGQIARNVQVGSGALRLGDGAVIGGNLSYTGDRAAQIASGAAVHGTIARHDAPRLSFWPAGGLLGSSAALGWLRGLVGLGILGLLFVALAPGYSRRTADTLGRSPWLSLGLGAALLIGVPLAAVAAFVIGLVVGGWWLAPLALALYALALMLGIVASGLFVGRWLVERAGGRRAPLAGAALLGLALLLLAGVVPIVGGLVLVVAMLGGLGALVLAAVRRQRARPDSAPQRTYRAPVAAGVD